MKKLLTAEEMSNVFGGQSEKVCFVQPGQHYCYDWYHCAQANNCYTTHTCVDTADQEVCVYY